ncbi:CPBP family glutamic-type intramembrane protease [Microbacterium trichothecenolyticum]|uniref:CPBP family glutamic-type intramembrane protease n=1 Tax=Microbacterium trichothecenolyticum TaxID=69370 RepID=UPI0027D8A983|nr:CPBP family glutamic-type intramembrane protease [Microbacterium trichothecenolyticum]
MILVATLIFAYYLGVKQLLFVAARMLALRLRRFSRHSRSEVQGVLELSFAVIGHIVFVVLFFAVSGVQLGDLGLDGPPLLLPLGALIGIGELAVAMFFCQLIVTGLDRSRVPVAVGASSAGTANPTSSWMSASRAGWVRHHISSFQVLPVSLSITLSGAQVACEEIVFRSLLIVLFQDSGIAVSFIIPGALFVIMQVFFMPSARAAMFPVVGGAIMAVVHGILFTSVPFVWPLIVAHVVFFYIAVL